MKLIIDIPEETYKAIMLGKWDNNGLAFYVKIGTPLDDVKAEIEKAYDDLDGYDPYALGTFANMVSDIFDNISKAESEEK